MKKFLIFILSIFTSIVIFAHAPILDINDNNDGFVYITGGFSNGESAAGTLIEIVRDKNYNGTEEARDGKMIIFRGELDKNAELILPKPKGKYIVIFDAGPGHVLEKKGPKLTDEEKEKWEKAIASDKKLGVWLDKWTGKIK